jgi:TolB-like protein/Tfp pilus assembly protein PilF
MCLGCLKLAARSNLKRRRSQGCRLGDGSAERSSRADGAVFLSYASEDAGAAERICTALRSAGIEVWFDRSELRGGDAWDAAIRKQIRSCALFLPVISSNTHRRDEGYFRLEWKLAIDRCHLMAADRAFLLPVVVDDTRDDDERVPDRFREVQWTRLPAGETTPVFVARVRRLLTPDPSSGSNVERPARESGSAAAPPTHKVGTSSWITPGLLLVAAVAGGWLLYLALNKSESSGQLRPSAHSTVAAASSGSAASSAVPAASFSPPPHSIAVLPFVNMSADKEQEYFSDGLTEEILNSLARIDELQVAARTSAFSFKGRDTTIATIARALNVGAILEGSVRRSPRTVRITAQLINAVTGFHLWSATYDRRLGDVLALQTEIATAVAGALKVTLLGDVAAKIELGGTQNPSAFDAYLHASSAYGTYREGKDLQSAIASYTEAIRLDPSYALAFAGRSIALSGYAADFATGAAVRGGFDKARADAERALALAPDLAEGHLALARFFDTGSLEFARANEEYERALALAPGNASISRAYGPFAVWMGRSEAGIATAQRAVVLDPLNRNTHNNLGLALYYARRYDEAIARFQDTLALDPESPYTESGRGLAFYALGNFQSARRSCEIKPDYWASQVCLALTYEKLGRRADARGMLKRLQASLGDAAAYQYAEISAQWGDAAGALDWLETALRLRDPGLGYLKTDPLLDPLHHESRFQAIERALKFPG